MDVILQIGAHRTASTSFQFYLRKNCESLAHIGVGFWGPHRLRSGMFHGVIGDSNLGVGTRDFTRASGRIGMQLERSAQAGLNHLLVSDENVLGIMRRNIASQTLYQSAGERVARYVTAFQGSIKAIHLSLRCPSTYWTSALSFCMPRGVAVPKATRIDALANAKRSWRDVITDISAAAPNTSIFVSTYEQHACAPQTLLSYLLAHPAPQAHAQIWRNRRPTAQDLLRLPLSAQELMRLQNHILAQRWEPFSQAQRATMQETYADDLFWLRAGADGLAHLLEDPKSEKMGYPAKLDFVNKGHRHDTRQRMARPG